MSDRNERLIEEAVQYASVRPGWRGDNRDAGARAAAEFILAALDEREPLRIRLGVGEWSIATADIDGKHVGVVFLPENPDEAGVVGEHRSKTADRAECVPGSVTLHFENREAWEVLREQMDELELDASRPAPEPPAEELWRCTKCGVALPDGFDPRTMSHDCTPEPPAEPWWVGVSEEGPECDHPKCGHGWVCYSCQFVQMFMGVRGAGNWVEPPAEEPETEEEIGRLRAALLRYGRHDDEEIGPKPCRSHQDGPDTCDCGLDADLEELGLVERGGHREGCS